MPGVTAIRTAFSVVLLGMLAVVLFAAIGPSRGVFANQSAQVSDHTVCKGIEHAQAAILEASTLDGVTTSTVEHLVAFHEALSRAAALEQEGHLREALQLEEGVQERIRAMVAMAVESDNLPLAELLDTAAEALDECLDRPQPEPLPQPIAPHLSYSSKFVCGREVDREPMKTRQNGKQTFLFTEEEYQTEINIHNFTGRPVTFRMRAAKANPIGAEPGRVSDVIERRLAPYQAMQVNCKSIARLLGKVRDHEVCDGKGQAQAVIEEIEGLLGDTAFDSTSTSAQLAYPAIERLIKALDKAIELEEDGKLKQAFKLERRIANQLENMAEQAERRGFERIAEHLYEARDLVHRCLGVLADDLAAQADSDKDAEKDGKANRLVDGFVSVQAPREIEVTAVYRATSSSTGFGGGVGSGIDVEVVQVRPHRVGTPAAAASVQYDGTY